MTTQKLEQVLEYLVNEENDKATDLLHEVFVEKAKTIYSELVESDADIEDDITEEAKDEDEAVEEAIGGDPEERFADNIESDEEEINAEEMFSEEDFDDEEAAEDLAGDMAPEGEGEEPDVEDAMMNVEDALEELKAAFAEMMGDDVEGEEEVVGDEEMPVDFEEPEMESIVPGEEVVEELEELEEAAELSAVAAPSNTEGADNKTSTVGPGGDARVGGDPVSQTGSDHSGYNRESAPAAGDNPDSPGTTEPSVGNVAASPNKDGADNTKSIHS
jgi:hypothetical protein